MEEGRELVGPLEVGTGAVEGRHVTDRRQGADEFAAHLPPLANEHDFHGRRRPGQP